MAKQTKHSNFFNTQFLTSCISTTLVLVLVGTIVTCVLVARNLSEFVRENINVTVLLAEDVDSVQAMRLKHDVEQEPYVRTADYISQEQARLMLCEEMGTDPTEFLEFNPLTASIELKIAAGYANSDSLTAVAETLRSNAKVADVLYEPELMDAVNKNIRRFSLILLIVALLFTYISFQLINNTVRLTIFSKRFSINTMRLVGASWGFIRKPFLKRSLILGVIAAVAANTILILGVYGLQTYEPEIRTVVTNEAMWIVGGAVLAFGLLITLTSTYLSLGKYLRMSSNELYHV
ncbi:MAG: cell division protein FtsX [Prevotellaceae bacterium]|nr:cell division protein FtsX [Prevotellaceae bacterium]